MLVRLASGESRTLVDAKEFGRDWAGWRADPEATSWPPSTSCAARAVTASRCRSVPSGSRTSSHAARRARVALSVGETVTLAVSLVRGVGELDPTGTVPGEWWLTDAGRPMLATDTSDREAAARTGELLRSLADGSPYAAALGAAAEAAGAARRSAHDLRLAEEELFAIAAPEPLATSLLGPRAARELAGLDRESFATADESGRASGWIEVLARHVDADLADVVSRATTGVWRRLRRARTTSRRPWVFAACAAAAVLTGGLLWPTGAGGPATADVPRPTASGSPAGIDTPSPTAQSSAVGRRRGRDGGHAD